MVVINVTIPISFLTTLIKVMMMMMINYCQLLRAVWHHLLALVMLELQQTEPL